jgi:hypothetical protein
MVNARSKWYLNYHTLLTTVSLDGRRSVSRKTLTNGCFAGWHMPSTLFIQLVPNRYVVLRHSPVNASNSGHMDGITKSQLNSRFSLLHILLNSNRNNDQKPDDKTMETELTVCQAWRPRGGRWHKPAQWRRKTHKQCAINRQPDQTISYKIDAANTDV